MKKSYNIEIHYVTGNMNFPQIIEVHPYYTDEECYKFSELLEVFFTKNDGVQYAPFALSYPEKIEEDVTYNQVYVTNVTAIITNIPRLVKDVENE